MNEKIKKTFRAITSAALSGAFVVSSVIGGGADSFVSSSVAFAEETFLLHIQLLILFLMILISLSLHINYIQMKLAQVVLRK